jgi:prepilin-type N-terminal cleavage/methylation domain-containing protein
MKGVAHQPFLQSTQSGNETSGFTLLELLVTVALAAVLATFVLRGAMGAGVPASLQSGQAAVANFVAAARARAIGGGDSTRILVHVDTGSPLASQRYLRYFVLQTHRAGEWRTVADLFLPRGVYVVPGNFAALPSGLFSPEPWVRGDGRSPLRSTALRANEIVAEAVESAGPEQWACITIAATGGTMQSGDLVLAAGGPRPAGSFAAGEAPVQLGRPELVRGVTLSVYGVAALVDDRMSF